MDGPVPASAAPLLALRARRLERLRATVESPGPAKPVPPVPAFAGPPRAWSLARALGGRVLRGTNGSTVVLEATGPLALPADRLVRLPDPIDPRHPLVCLDTETTGLGTGAGTVPFLVGLGTWDGESFTVRQFVLPDHPDEPAFLDAVAAAIPASGWLVSYNGRSFDWPLLVTRYRLHRQGPPAHAGHLDLLPIARQVWRHRLPDARLASVEAGVCGIRRSDDLPGALIPERYFAYLRTARGELLRDVLRHNRQDVASLARLLLVLAQGLDPDSPGRSMPPGDLSGLGSAYVRRRRYDEALCYFDGALARAGEAPGSLIRGVPLAERVTVDRARLLCRLGRHAEASSDWRSIAQAGGRLAALGWVQLAKHVEHRERSPARAYEMAMQAAAVARRERASGSPQRWVERDLERRLPRLRGRLATARSDGRATRPPRLDCALADGGPVEARALHDHAGCEGRQVQCSRIGSPRLAPRPQDEGGDGPCRQEGVTCPGPVHDPPCWHGWQTPHPEAARIAPQVHAPLLPPRDHELLMVPLQHEVQARAPGAEILVTGARQVRPPHQG